MKWIDRLNNKLDYNEEIFILSYIVGVILFLSAGFLFRTYMIGALVLIGIAIYVLGIATAFILYEKAEFVTNGIELRDKIRRLFRR